MEIKREELGARYLTRIEQAIYYFFLNRIFVEQTNIFAEGQKKLAKLIGSHENSILLAVKSFEKKGWIKRIKDGSRNALEFTPPESELLCRMSYCSGIKLGSYSSLNMREELETIVNNLELELEELQKETTLLEKQQNELEEKAKKVTKQQISDLVDRLLKRLGDRFDNRTFEEKALLEMTLFKKRINEGKNLITSPSLGLSQHQQSMVDYYEWKSEEVLEGILEIQKMEKRTLEG